MWTLGLLRKRLFSISPDEATFARRGFRPTSPPVQRRLERVGETFLGGYSAALEAQDAAALEQVLNQVDHDFRGFAFEGAAMALGLFDFITPWRRDRLDVFLQGPGDAHAYMVHVGLGWAAARVPWVRRSVERRLAGLDPLLRWLVLDGYGFHQGYFHWPLHVRRQRMVPWLSPYGQRAFDQGLGRSLWFVEGADVPRIVATIASFDDGRQADLWSGIGLACAYAGGARRQDLEALRDAARQHFPPLAQGAAFAAKARQRAGNEADHAELACRVLCGSSASAAAAVTDQCLEDLRDEQDRPAYESWRRRVQEQLLTDASPAAPPGLRKEGAAS